MTTTISDQSLIASFNRGTVLTTFTPPTSCESTFTLYQSDLCMGHYHAAPYNAACYPAGTEENWDVYYWSPAQCPNGMVPATTFTDVFVGSGTVLSLGSETTAVACCPTGFDYFGDGHQCGSVIGVTRNDAIATVLYFNTSITSVTDYAPTSEATISTLTADATIRGDGIAVWWQSSDLANFVASSTSTPSSSFSTQSTTSSPTTPTSNTSTSTSSTTPTPQPSSGLSSGAKIGIGIGIPIAVVICGIIAFLVYKRRSSGFRKPGSGQTELDGFEIQKPQELSGEGKFTELHANSARAEMHADNPPVELEGS